jgi:hypothetical protein
MLNLTYVQTLLHALSLVLLLLDDKLALHASTLVLASVLLHVVNTAREPVAQPSPVIAQPRLPAPTPFARPSPFARPRPSLLSTTTSQVYTERDCYFLNVTGDGNCGVYALLVQLHLMGLLPARWDLSWSAREQAQQLREQLVDWSRDVQNLDVDHWRTTASRAYTVVGNEFFEVAAELFDVNVVIFTAETSHFYFLSPSGGSRRAARQTVYLGHLGRHWVAGVPPGAWGELTRALGTNRFIKEVAQRQPEGRAPSWRFCM